MSTEATNNITNMTLQMPPPASEKVDTSRKAAKDNPAQVEESSTKTPVQPEEILSKINALAEDGTYSVRFETDPDTKKLVVKIVNSGTQEVIRQIPAEKMLGLEKALTDFTGIVIDRKQ